MHIMVVDDEDDIIRLTSAVLEMNNHKITSACSGNECLEKLNAGIMPDIILLDLMMPGISGYETCMKIKTDQRFKRIPVIIFSAKSGRDDIEYAYRLGIDGYITKPFDPQDLLKQVERHVKALTGHVPD